MLIWIASSRARRNSEFIFFRFFPGRGLVCFFPSRSLGGSLWVFLFFFFMECVRFEKIFSWEKNRRPTIQFYQLSLSLSLKFVCFITELMLLFCYPGYWYWMCCVGSLSITLFVVFCGSMIWQLASSLYEQEYQMSCNIWHRKQISIFLRYVSHYFFYKQINELNQVVNLYLWLTNLLRTCLQNNTTFHIKRLSYS